MSRASKGVEEPKGIAMRLTPNSVRQGLDPEAIKGMARGIVSTRPDEIGCDGCFEGMDLLAELTLAGRDGRAGPAVEEAMREVEEHLVCCRDCREEYQGLLRALQAVI
jgi:hypothetical protein